MDLTHVLTPDFQGGALPRGAGREVKKAEREEERCQGSSDCDSSESIVNNHRMCWFPEWSVLVLVSVDRMSCKKSMAQTV